VNITSIQPVCVSAAFPSGNKRYSYFVPPGDVPKEGDLIVTSVAWEDGCSREVNGERLLHGGGIATVAEVHYLPQPGATKQYLFLVSREMLEKRRLENRERAELEKKKKAAQEKLDAMLKAMDRTLMYERLAAANPEAAELLKLLKS
jgi:hypothetical protein